MKKLLVPLVLLFIFSCSEKPQATTAAPTIAKNEDILLTVFKDPNCGCCSKWIDHLEAHNISVKAINTRDMDAVKEQKHIPAAYQSCHTAISKEGYFFEGHIPAKTIARFLKEQPEGLVGLTAPAMPVGSPGMEVQDKFQPYKVFAMNASGVMTEYAAFERYEEQF